MALRFPYRSFPTKGPLWQLGGLSLRARPVITVTALVPGRTAVTDGLLDTGSDDTVFSEVVAQTLGLDLTNSPEGESSGVGNVPARVRFAEVTLRISDGREHREWLARVGFTSAPLKRPLLGQAGFLEFFTATFHADLEEIELAVNSRYRGI